MIWRLDNPVAWDCLKTSSYDHWSIKLDMNTLLTCYMLQIWLIYKHLWSRHRKATGVVNVFLYSQKYGTIYIAVFHFQMIISQYLLEFQSNSIYLFQIT
jgi:hypothetical protein